MGSEYSGKGGKVMEKKEIQTPPSHCFSSWGDVDASKEHGNHRVIAGHLIWL